MTRHPDPASFERRERSRRRAWWLLGAALAAMLLAWAVLDTGPAASTLPTAGKVHTSSDYPRAAFSDAEWNDEERTRFLEELGRDVARAEAEVRRLAAAPR
jgi:hypothetical protein